VLFRSDLFLAEEFVAKVEEIERKKIIKIRQDIEALEGISLRSDSEER
jgi:hypothetical protein